MVGQFRVEVQRIEPVVLAREIQESDRQFGSALREAVAGKQIELPEIVTRQVRAVAKVTLRGPQGLRLGKEAGGMVKDRKQVQLVQDRPVVGAWNYRARDLREARLEPGLAKPVAPAQGPI